MKYITNDMIATRLLIEGEDPQSLSESYIQTVYEEMREEVGNPVEGRKRYLPESRIRSVIDMMRTYEDATEL